MTTTALFTSAPRLEVTRLRAPSDCYHHFLVSEPASGAAGFGGSEDPMVAQTKALFEWIERKAFREVQAFKSNTSSGWAAHVSPELASLGAERELLERDAVLCAWLLKRPPALAGELEFPSFGRAFPLLRFGTGKGFVILGAVLEASEGRILIAACESTEKEARAKLLVDSERARWVLMRGVDGAAKAHHVRFCAMDRAELAWLFSGGQEIRYLEIPFTHELIEAPLWNGTTAWVAKAASPALQAFFFGETREENLNLARLRGLGAGDINKELHPFL